MSAAQGDDLERDWAQLGVLFGCEPSGRTPDLERLLLDTARRCPENARLLPTVVTWLVCFGYFVARHRLRRLAQDQLEPDAGAVLGLFVEAAVAHGATRELLIVSEVCQRREHPVPLSSLQRDRPSLSSMSERRASEVSSRWGVWAPPVKLRHDAIRPVTWLLSRNPDYRERIIRKGDLRVSILETLRQDLAGHEAPSESVLARLSGATRTAVRKALAALRLEGEIEVGAEPSNARDHPVRLRLA